MSLKRIVVNALAVLAFTAGAVTVANALPLRTFVSGFGDDASTCITPNFPCRTFQVAVNKVAANGEVVALDSAGYGAVSITKALTLIGTGVSASVTSSGAGNAITIAIPPGPGSRRVILRDLRVQGFGAGTNGIEVTDVGSLHIQGCTIERFHGSGIFWNNPTTVGRLLISETTSQDNHLSGLEVAATNITHVTIDDSRFLRNGDDGVDFSGGDIDASISGCTFSENGDNGVDVDSDSTSRVAVTRSTAASNTIDGYFVSDGQLNIDLSTAHRNGRDGIRVEGGQLRVSRSIVTNNVTCGFNRFSGTLERNAASNGSMVLGNGTDTCNLPYTTFTAQ